MRVLSLFDGISCGRLALERAGFEVERYVAYEIDKHAIAVSKANWPDIEHRGDVELADFEEFRGFDLVIAGSPCQGFSFAGKQLNFEDPRSRLFFEFTRAVYEVDPKYFFLENVVMRKEYEAIITEHMGVAPIKLNSKLVSAQLRSRLYWTNIPGVLAPDDKGLLFRDIVDYAAPFKGKAARTFVDRDKSLALTTRSRNSVALTKGGLARYLNKNIDQLVFGEVYPASIVGRRINEKGVRDDYNKGVPISQCLQVKHDPSKIGCLTTVSKDNLVSLTKPGRYLDAYNRGDLVFRALTRNEMERAQTLPDNYTSAISESKASVCLGNAWTVDMIAHIFSFMHQVI